MKFKDLVNSDTEKVFFAENEFAEKAIWNGQEVLAIIDEEAGAQRKPRENNFSLDYITKEQIIVSIISSKIQTPLVNQFVNLNKKEYKVIGCSYEFGVLNITLEAIE